MSKKHPPIPLFDYPITETHCHLDFLDEAILDTVINTAVEHGVHRFVTIGTAPENLDRVIEISAKHENVWCTLGVHPHDAKSVNKDVLDFIQSQSTAANKVIAIGEIGLDYHYEYSDRKIQQQVFESQMQLACDLNLPVVIHSREADEDTKAILANFTRKLQNKGVIHSFTSGIKLAEYCLSEDFMLGFNGIVTFNKAENVREVLHLTPLEQLVVETDSPYLTPVPYRGKDNEPKYLPFIVARIAEEKGITIDQLLQILERNATRLFPLMNQDV